MKRAQKAPSSLVAPDVAPDALPTVAHTRRLVVFLGVLLVVSALSFIAGAFVRAPEQSALDAASDELEVTYPVEERIVAPGVTLPGRVVSGETKQLDVLSSASGGVGGVERLIVTQQTLAAGQPITPGTMLGEVSGRPLFAIPTGVPLYRDLVDGSMGADVSAFQSALQQMGLDVSVTGEVGQRTLSAVIELYERLGVTPAVPSVISWTEFLPVNPGATVVYSAVVGTVIMDDAPLATVKISPDVVMARANVLEADQLIEGQTVQLRSGTGTSESTVLHIGEFTVPEDNSGAGRDVTIGIPEGFEVTDSTPITVSAEGNAQAGAAVPVIALRQDDKGTYLELPDSGDPSNENSSSVAKRVKIYVTVTAQSAGWAAIDAKGQLSIGDKVHVSP